MRIKDYQYIHLKYAKDLADKFEVGDKFHVRTGAWYGVVKEKDNTGVTVDVCSDYDCKNVVHTVHHSNDKFIDLDVYNITPKKIVFDVDDIMWGLNKRVAEKTGVDFNKLTTFSIFENPVLSESEKNMVLKAYGDSTIFRNIEWYSGAEKIMELEKYDVKVFINSNCYQEEIAALKYMQIHQLINIPNEQLILNVFDVNLEEHKKKEIGGNVLAFIDDSPHNLLAAKADNLYTLNKPWNINVPELKNLNIKRFNTLEEIIDDLSKELSNNSGLVDLY